MTHDKYFVCLSDISMQTDGQKYDNQLIHPVYLNTEEISVGLHPWGLHNKHTKKHLGLLFSEDLIIKIFCLVFVFISLDSYGCRPAFLPPLSTRGRTDTIVDLVKCKCFVIAWNTLCHLAPCWFCWIGFLEWECAITEELNELS